MPQGRPWVWLVDHPRQGGAFKLLVMAGGPLGDVPFGPRALGLADARRVAGVPMPPATAERVAAEREQAGAPSRGRPDERERWPGWRDAHRLVQATSAGVRRHGWTPPPWPPGSKRGAVEQPPRHDPGGGPPARGRPPVRRTRRGGRTPG